MMRPRRSDLAWRHTHAPRHPGGPLACRAGGQCVNWAGRAHDGCQQTQREEAPDMTAGDHFERVAGLYDSLRTTDKAPVRRIGQLLPHRPVTGLDIGCGTVRYTRLLRAVLPDGSLLAAADVSAAMLAQLKAANGGHVLE